MMALIIFATMTLVMAPGMSREGSGQQMVPGMHVGGRGVQSMGMMSDIMKDMDQNETNGSNDAANERPHNYTG
jgi:hypothetical protein